MTKRSMGDAVSHIEDFHIMSLDTKVVSVKYQTRICEDFVHGYYTDLTEVFVPKGYHNSPISFIVNNHRDIMGVHQHDEPRNIISNGLISGIKTRTKIKTVVLGKKFVDYCVATLQQRDAMMTEFNKVIGINK